jgi:hypothetical protein
LSEAPSFGKHNYIRCPLIGATAYGISEDVLENDKTGLGMGLGGAIPERELWGSYYSKVDINSIRLILFSPAVK